MVQTQSAATPFTYAPSVRRAGNVRVSPARTTTVFAPVDRCTTVTCCGSTPSISEETVSVALRGRTPSPSSVSNSFTTELFVPSDCDTAHQSVAPSIFHATDARRFRAGSLPAP